MRSVRVSLIVAVVSALGAMPCGRPASRALGADAGVEDGRTPNEKTSISLTLGQSKVVSAPWPTKRVSVTDPGIADVKGLTAKQTLLMSKAIGTTDLLMWSQDEDLWRAKVEVVADLAYLRDELKRLFPRATLNVRQSKETVIVTGNLARAEHAEQLRKFLTVQGLKHADFTSVAGVQQVQIQVRVAEVSRACIRAIGINWVYTGEDAFVGSTIGADGGGPVNPVSIGVPGGTVAGPPLPFEFTQTLGVSSSVTLFAGFPDLDFQVFLQALKENQYLRILAEPNLTALSGEEGDFLVGGEFPIPVVQSGATGGSSAISIEYKEFGVKLRFRPTVLGDGTIRLRLAPEVSQLSSVGAITIQGFQVPAVVTRKVETTLELKSGQTFGMAGLLQRTHTGRSSRVPGLGDLPILGALFRSARYESDETELVVLVTASLVEPSSSAHDLPLPGATHTPPNDWELYALGRIEGKTPARLSPTQADWLRKSGLARLRGPGAWTTYGSAPVPVLAAESPQKPEPNAAKRQAESQPNPLPSGGREATSTKTDAR